MIKLKVHVNKNKITAATGTGGTGIAVKSHTNTNWHGTADERIMLIILHEEIEFLKKMICATANDFKIAAPLIDRFEILSREMARIDTENAATF